ncbi:MAG: lipopolysaccharide biosynthesis protein [Leptolyngbya sp. IPPAS B-1204]|nr:MAG: lipopolysaccharide biosynthesis protein [Leptolyngbya sp. IPPAS B-1204]
MSIREKAIQGVLWSALQNWGSQVGSLLVFFLLARLLTPEAFGLVAMANIFLAFMQIFLQQGFAQSLIQRQDLEPEHIDTAFWTNLAIGACLTAFGLTAAGWVAAQFQQPQLTPILQVLSLLFLITACGNVQQALLERAFNFRATATRALAATLVGGAAGIGLALAGFGVWSLVGQQVIQELTGVLVLWHASDWRPRFRVSLSHFWQLFHFGMPILGFNFLNFLNSRADDLLIGYFLGAVPLGYYSIAYRILGVMQQLLVQTSQQIALPTFSRLQSDLEQFRQAFYTATQLTSLIAFPIFLGVLVLAPELVVMLFGEQWTPSIPVLQVLSLAGIFQSISFFKSSVFMAMGKPSWSLWLSLLTVVLNLIGFSIAVRWGIVAVAAAFVIRGYVVFPIGQWAVSRLIHIPVLVYVKQFTVPLLSAITMAGFLFLLRNWLLALTSLYILVVPVSALLGALFYIGLIRFCSPTLFYKLLTILYSPFTKKVKTPS